MRKPVAPLVVAVAACTLLTLLPATLHAGVEAVGCFDSGGNLLSVGSTWNDTFNGTAYYCRCTSSGSSCSPSGSSGGGSSGSHGSSGGLSYKNQMKLQMMQSIMDSAANAFIRWLNAPPTPASQGPSPEELAARKAEEERAAAEYRAKVQQQISDMQAEYERQQQQTLAEKKSRLLAGLKRPGQDTAPPLSNALQQLRCKAYWGEKAARSASADEARQFSIFAENPDAGALAECAQALPEPPEPPQPDDFRLELYQTLVEEINLRLPQIEQARAKQQEADVRLVEKQQQVETLKSRKETAATPADQQAADDLLAAAMQELAAADTLKKEADAGLKKLNLEMDALQEVEKLAAGPKPTANGKGIQP